MSFFRSKKTVKCTRGRGRLPEGAHENFMGGASYDIQDPLHALRVAAASCFFGEPMYYHPSGKGAAAVNVPATLLEEAIDRALSHDAEATLKLAVRLRNEDHVRTTPQVILVRAANSKHVRGSGLIRTYAPSIMKRADEPSVALAYQLARYGRPVPNALKRAWKARIERARPYELAKYREEGKTAKTVDVVRFAHAKGDHVTKLVRGELTNDAATWESLVSLEGSTKATWTRAIPLMGHLALLRNLRNLMKHDVARELYLPRLVATAKDAEVFPFRYASAYFTLKAEGSVPNELVSALESCIALRLSTMRRLSGRVVALADNSGSAQGTFTSSLGTMRVSTISNLTGVLAARMADEGALGVFGDKLQMIDVPKSGAILPMLAAAEKAARDIGQATENGVWLFLDRALRTREHIDHLFILSDMQAGHGGLYGSDPSAYVKYQVRGRYIDVASLVREYRRKVNPDVMVYLVQVAGYADTLVPEMNDLRTLILGGFGEGLLAYASRMAELANVA